MKSYLLARIMPRTMATKFLPLTKNLTMSRARTFPCPSLRIFVIIRRRSSAIIVIIDRWYNRIYTSWSLRKFSKLSWLVCGNRGLNWGGIHITRK